jgi:hypothetical protein
MGKIARYASFILLLSTLFWLAACEWTLSGSKRAAVLEFSEPTIDNLFDGLTANDYALFSRDFDSDMFEQVPAADFAVWQQEWDRELGRYLSRQVERVAQSDEFYVVVYQAEFEKEAPVTVSVAFHRSGTIAFLAFESETYSWSAWE